MKSYSDERAQFEKAAETFRDAAFPVTVNLQYESKKEELDMTNWQMIGTQGEEIIVMMPKPRMTKKEALVHAAWLVALADDDESFDKILTEVLSK